MGRRRRYYAFEGRISEVRSRKGKDGEDPVRFWHLANVPPRAVSAPASHAPGSGKYLHEKRAVTLYPFSETRRTSLIGRPMSAYNLSKRLAGSNLLAFAR